MIKRKIGLIELYSHSEVLLTMYQLLRLDFEVTVFTTQKIHKDAQEFFGERLENWIINSPKNSKENFVSGNFAHFNMQDLLIFITLIDSYRFFSRINFSPKTILIIHNVNALLQSQENRWFNTSSVKMYLLDLLVFFRNYIRRDAFYKRKMLHNFDHFSFPSEQVTSYAKALRTNFTNKIIAPLPFAFFTINQREKARNPSIIISIPGVVFEHVRDYELAFQVFSELVPSLQQKVTLQFLGSAETEYGVVLMNKFQTLENDNFEIIFFQKFLSQNEFDRLLRRTDFAILPIKQLKKFGIIQEIYGISNITGGINDVLRFGIPTLLIDHYKVDKIEQSIVAYFKDKDSLLELVKDWIINSKFEIIRKDAIPILEHKNEENTRLRIVNLLNGILLRNVK